MVQLELDRKTLLLSFLGLCLAGFLIFVAGMVVAIYWYLPSYAAELGVAGDPAPGETETVTRALQPRTSSGVGATTPPPAAVPRGTGGTVPRAPRLRVPRPPTPRAPSLRGRAPSAVARVDLDDAPPPAAEPAVYEEPAVYSVQVGAFASEFNMESLLLELQDRGYQPYVVTISINRQILHTVRIGEYGSREEASRAAESFFEQEGMAAVVREVVSSFG